MKLHLFSIAFLATILTTFTAADQTETTFLGEEVKVVNNVIDLTNTHRKSGVLRFSVNGVNVTKVSEPVRKKNSQNLQN